MPLNANERAAVERVRTAANGKGHPYCEHDYNIHRWITAYGGDEEEAAKVGNKFIDWLHAKQRGLGPQTTSEYT